MDANPVAKQAPACRVPSDTFRTDDHERVDGREKGQYVDYETRCFTRQVQNGAGSSRARQTRSVERKRVERDRVRSMTAVVNDFQKERLPGGHLDPSGRTHDDGGHEQDPRRKTIRIGHHRKPRRGRHRHYLRNDEYVSPLQPVGKHAPDG